MYVSVQERQQREYEKRSAGRIALVVVSRFFAVFGVLLLSIIILFFGAVTMVCRGPSPAARDLFVNTVMETSAAKFLASIYFSDEEIAQIQTANAVVHTNEKVNTDEIVVEHTPDVSKDTIEVLDIFGATFKGKLMIVHDPSRLQLATIPEYGPELQGKRVRDYVRSMGAVAGITAGRFDDNNGTGIGGTPLGLVIKDGKIVCGSENTKDSVIGFDKDHKLVVGVMTGAEALALNVRDAVSFGPVLIVNGHAAEVAGTGGGLNPRTAIGQRKDGAVLLLVIDGRQPNSVGGTYQDCIDVLLQYEAVNAANLDGGSSTVMIYNDEIINSCASLYGPRQVPTAFVVM